MNPANNNQLHQLGWYVRNSTIVHVGLVALLIITGMFFKNAFETKRKFNLNLVKASVKVDVVAMPRFTIKELKSVKVDLRGDKLPVQKVDAPKVSENPSDITFKKAKAKLSFEQMMKKMAAKKVKVKKGKSKRKGKGKGKDKSLSSSQQKALKNLVFAGNKLSEGGSTYGDQRAEGQGEFVTYLESLRESIKVNWKLPSYLMEKDYNCRIRIFLNSSGELIRAKIIESSNSKEYDQKAMEAVKNSNPFPELAKSIQARGIKGEIVLGFPL